MTYLAVDGPRIAGYCCLSAGSIARDAAAPALSTRAPDPIPVVLMGRFAVATSDQGQGLALDLLADALVRAVAAGEVIGARLLLVHAIKDGVRGFYERWGFEASPFGTLTLMRDLRCVASEHGRHP